MGKRIVEDDLEKMIDTAEKSVDTMAGIMKKFVTKCEKQVIHEDLASTAKIASEIRNSLKFQLDAHRFLREIKKK